MAQHQPMDVEAEQPTDTDEGPANFYNYQHFEDEHFRYPIRAFKKRGLAIIINNAKGFTHTKLKMKERKWSDYDESSLKRALIKQNFLEEDIIVERDCSANQIRSILQEVAGRDFTDYACLIVVILSYGEDGMVYGTDETLTYQQLVLPFHRVSTLFDKPKFFIVQTERPGSDPVQHDGPIPPLLSSGHPITEPDVLFGYNLDPESICIRTGGLGTYYVQRLSEVLCADATNIDLDRLDMVNLLTRVSQLVRIDLGGYCGKSPSEKCCCPRFITHLTKDFKFI